MPSHQVGEQERSEQGPAPADSSEPPEQSVQPSPPMPMQLMNTPCHSGVHSESNVPDHLWDWWNDDQQRQRLQVQPWNNGDPWNQCGIVASRTGHQQNHSWDQWNRWNANDWNHWSSWSARGNDDGWSSLSQWYREQKKYFDKSPPPEWGGNHPEKTWRDYRRTLKQWLSTTDVPPEKHGVLLWRALTGDAKLLTSHFSVTKTYCIMLGRGYSTNCTVSATRRCCSLRMWPALPEARRQWLPVA